jgi:hypothetical protein
VSTHNIWARKSKKGPLPYPKVGVHSEGNSGWSSLVITVSSQTRDTFDDWMKGVVSYSMASITRVRLQVLPLVSKKITTFSTCSLTEVDLCFRSAYCLHYQGVMMESVSSQMSVYFYKVM